MLLMVKWLSKRNREHFCVCFFIVIKKHSMAVDISIIQSPCSCTCFCLHLRISVLPCRKTFVQYMYILLEWWWMVLQNLWVFQSFCWILQVSLSYFWQLCMSCSVQTFHKAVPDSWFFCSTKKVLNSRLSLVLKWHLN